MALQTVNICINVYIILYKVNSCIYIYISHISNCLLFSRHLACTDIRTCEVPAGPYSETCEDAVESNPQAVFKPPADTSHVRISVRVRYQQVPIQRPVRRKLNLTPQVRSRAPWGARSGDAGLPGLTLKRRSRSKS